MRLALGIWMLLGWPVQAQESPVPPAGLAFWIGGDFVPKGLDRTCASGDGGMVVFGGSLMAPLGPVSLEGRMGRHWRPRLDCVWPSLEPGPGTYTTRSPALPGGNFTSLDLRVRWVPFPAEPWTVAAGAGWAASSKDVPYLTTSVGARSGVGSSSLALDVEVGAYHVPWTSETTTFALEPTSGDLIVIESFRRSSKDWAFTVGLRLGIEIPMEVGRRD